MSDEVKSPIGATGAQIKRDITDEKKDAKTEEFDPGMAMLGTDNEAGSAPDPDGMAESLEASSSNVLSEMTQHDVEQPGDTPSDVTPTTDDEELDDTQTPASKPA